MLDYNNPKSFKEKLLTLKVKKYNCSPLVKQCADKYAVRTYIKKMLGNEPDVLVPLLHVYNHEDEIEWDKLPNKFVLKWNFGCGFNIVCRDKNTLDIKQATNSLRKWRNDTTYLIHAELQYRNVNKKILVEKFLDSVDGSLPSDYKVYCFNGKPRCILFISGRDTESESAAFYDLSWNFIGRPNKDCYSKNITLVEKPLCLNKMLECASKLSTPFDFVRVDFYVVNDKLYFGEMTFTPASGLNTSECEINGVSMGDLLIIT